MENTYFFLHTREMNKTTKRVTSLFMGLMVVLNMGIFGFAVEKPTPQRTKDQIIEQWIQKGYLVGDPDGNHHLDRTITKAEFSVLINKMNGYSETSEKIREFTDIKDSDWYYHTLSIAVQKGYINGNTNRELQPNAKLRKTEAVVMLHNLDKKIVNYDLSMIRDGKEIPNWAQQSFEWALTGGLVTTTQGKLSPLAPLTRGEAIYLLDHFDNNNQMIPMQSKIEEESLYKDGIYQGTGKGYGGDIEVSVEIKAGKIIAIKVLKEKEDGIYFKSAQKVIDRILEKQQPDVDVSSGATISSKGIIYAVKDALEKAKIKKDEEKQGKYIDGDYEGWGKGYNGLVKVNVRIEKGNITKATLLSHTDDGSYMSSAENLLRDIVDKQTPDVDVVSGATYSCNGIKAAVRDALIQAEGKTKKPGESNGLWNWIPNWKEKIVPKPDQKDFINLKDGIYIGQADGYRPMAFKVQVIVDGRKITAIKLIHNHDDQGYFSDDQADRIGRQIIAAQSTKAVDIISGATYSSRGYIAAVINALRQSSDKNLIITKDNTIVEGRKIEGDLIIDASVGEGTVHIRNTIIKGNTYIYGGGSRSIYFENSTLEKNMMIDSVFQTRIVFQGQSQMKNTIIVRSSTKIETQDGNVNLIPRIQIENKEKYNKPINTTIDANVKNVFIGAIDAKVVLGSKTNIDKIESFVIPPDAVENMDESNRQVLFMNQKGFTLSLEKNEESKVKAIKEIILKEKKGSLKLDIPNDIDEVVYEDGVYEAVANGYRQTTWSRVQVTIENNRIKDIKLLEFGGDDGYQGRSYENMKSHILKNNDPQRVFAEFKTWYEATMDIYSAPNSKKQAIQVLGKQYEKQILELDNSMDAMNRKNLISHMVRNYLKDTGAQTLDVVSGATWSGKGIVYAINNALEKAKPSRNIVDIVFISGHEKKNYFSDEVLDLTALKAKISYKAGHGPNGITEEIVAFKDFPKKGLELLIMDDQKIIPTGSGKIALEKYVNRVLKIAVRHTKETVSSAQWNCIVLPKKKRMFVFSEMAVKVEGEVEPYPIAKLKIINENQYEIVHGQKNESNKEEKKPTLNFAQTWKVPEELNGKNITDFLIKGFDPKDVQNEIYLTIKKEEADWSLTEEPHLPGKKYVFFELDGSNINSQDLELQFTTIRLELELTQQKPDDPNDDGGFTPSENGIETFGEKNTELKKIVFLTKTSEFKEKYIVGETFSFKGLQIKMEYNGGGSPSLYLFPKEYLSRGISSNIYEGMELKEVKDMPLIVRYKDSNGQVISSDSITISVTNSNSTPDPDPTPPPNDPRIDGFTPITTNGAISFSELSEDPIFNIYASTEVKTFKKGEKFAFKRENVSGTLYILIKFKLKNGQIKKLKAYDFHNESAVKEGLSYNLYEGMILTKGDHTLTVRYTDRDGITKVVGDVDLTIIE